MKIAYNGFWPLFDPSHNWFNQMFREYFKGEDIVFSGDPTDADILVNSVFGPAITDGPARKILYTGESFKHGYTDDQILLGFDRTDVAKQKYRLPIWIVFTNWWPETYTPPYYVGGPNYVVDANKLVLPRTEKEVNEILGRENFCCIVASNPVENRIIAYNQLSDIKPVDGYGHIFRNHIQNRKEDILKHYSFNICFENTIVDGYVTEKLYEALLAGTTPIYWGDKMSKEDFNEKAFIDYTSMDSMDDLVDHVKKVYASKDLMAEYLSQPICNEVPSLDGLYEFFDQVKLK
jgi:hypothetical protein